MKTISFNKRLWGRGLVVCGLGMGLLVGGILPVKGDPPVLREEVIPKVDVTNLLCVGSSENAHFEVAAISSTVQSLINNKKVDCAAELQDLLSRGFGIVPGGGGGVAGIPEDGTFDVLVPTATGFMYTLTKPRASIQLSDEG